MHLGMPTLIETETIEDCAALCAELGLQFIELNMNLPQYQLDKIDVSILRRIAEHYGIYYTIHLDENLNVSDFNTYVAESYRRTVLETIELAKKLWIPVLNMHLSQGVYFTLPEKRIYLFDKYKEQYLQSIENFRDMCEAAIGSSGIKMCVENSDGYRDFQIEAIALLLKSSVFALTFDIGHNYCVGGIDEPVIMRHKDRLCHMHFHDARGSKQNHLALGTGEIDLMRYIAIAKAQNCRIVLETKTIAGLKESVRWIRENI